RVAALRGRLGSDARIIVLSTSIPSAPADSPLRAAGPGLVFDVVDLASADGLERLSRYASGMGSRPLKGFWRDSDLESRP
ncbi:MAG TPA: hypothetical protein VFV02_17280, partial [Acidimicrobiales bacterium]|nr:hypothetical protein [Acidimicrobiales bacterium]